MNYWIALMLRGTLKVTHVRHLVQLRIIVPTKFDHHLILLKVIRTPLRVITPPEGSYWRSSHAGSDSWHQGDRENQRDWYDNDHRTPYERLCDEVPDDRKVWVRMPWIQSRTSFEQRKIDEGYARYERNASRRVDTDYQREYQGRSSSDHDSNQYPSSSWSHQTTLQPINSELEW